MRRSRREFYSIGEVCSMLGLRPHVLRYWETQFEQLAPPKTRSGNRVYRAAEVELIALIKRLVHDERYTLEGARRRLQELDVEDATEASAALALERSFLGSLRGELQALHELLDPDGD